MYQDRCKICGAPLELSNTSRYVECDYCNSKFELDPNRAAYANHYSIADDAWGRKDFEEALKHYLAITEMDNLQSEAHWGAALCRYGIAYEIDPVSGEKMPTCNLINQESIFNDKNYLSAIKHASPENAEKYLKRAQEIERISAEFLKIVENQPPYDVFISYKRNDDRGARTIDSEYAMKLYLFLKDKGLRVFFAEETLNGIAGSLFEPHIFAALHSAKVMVLFASCREYVESTWVKNEWQRFLKLMEADPEKALMPAYFGDPRKVLPERLQPLQSFHAGATAFVEEVLENIKKKQNNNVLKERTVSAGASLATFDSLLERAFMLAGDGEFEKAAKQLEKVLDIDPKCARAYLCNLMVEFRVTKESDLGLLMQRIDLSPNYRKVMDFGSEELRQKVTGYSAQISARLGEAELRRQEMLQKKNALAGAVAKADQILDGINANRERLKEEITKEESSLTVLRGRIEEATETLKKTKKSFIPPIIWGLLAVVLGALFVLWGYQNNPEPSALLFFLACFLPAAIILGILVRSFSVALLVEFCVSLLCFVVSAVIESGGLLETILGLMWDLTIGLLFDDGGKVLSHEMLAQGILLSGLAFYAIAIIVGIYKQFSRGKKTRERRRLQKQIDADTAEYNAKAQQNTELIRLQQELAQENAKYDAYFASFKQQLTQANQAYLLAAQNARQRPDPVLPEKYQ
ncbi:MAG: TIR domain-containing protein [Ruminococcaceae bacterium]|nr:TIR domain-containing protein [Oscillospiraceae bacterium]